MALEEELIFAPLIRVSSEKQERRGESLRTQRTQLEQAIESLGGEVFQWYEGQEHATPDYERKILEKLMADAHTGKFNAVIVADLSRWSRDNGKSKQYTKALQRLGIKFFEGGREIDLFDPAQAFILGMGVEVQEFFAKQMVFKSVTNRAHRAKRGLPTSGKLPYGRTWDKKAQAWRVDEEKHALVQKMAKFYLENNLSWEDMGKMFSMAPSYLHKLLCKRCGPTWTIHFKSKDFNIDEVVTMNLPPLLPDETIQAIWKKSEARRTWDKKPQKNKYLFSRLIFDADMGKAMTGLTNNRGKKYYKTHNRFKPRIQINADTLEKAILTELYEALGNKKSLRAAVFEGNPLGKVADKLNDDLETKKAELALVERQLDGFVTAIGSSDDVLSFMARIKPKIVELEARSRNLKDDITSIEQQLSSLPSEQEIEGRRKKWAGLVQRIHQSYLESGQAFHDLPFEAQRQIIKLVFGGKDEEGRRYGIYIRSLGGSPKRYWFEAYGKLGVIDGWLESRTGRSDAEAIGPILKGITEEIGKVILENDQSLSGVAGKDKVHSLGILQSQARLRPGEIMAAQGLSQTGHLAGGAVIQDVHLQVLVGDAFDCLERGPDYFQGLSGTRHQDVHRPLAIRVQAFGPMAPKLPDVQGQQPEEQKGEHLGRQEEEKRGFTVAYGQGSQPEKVGNSQA